MNTKHGIAARTGAAFLLLRTEGWSGNWVTKRRHRSKTGRPSIDLIIRLHRVVARLEFAQMLILI